MLDDREPAIRPLNIHRTLAEFWRNEADHAERMGKSQRAARFRARERARMERARRTDA